MHIIATPAFSCCRKREHSARWRQSAAAFLFGLRSLSTSPHKRGMEIMRPWPWCFHTWPSPSPQIWSTTETDAHVHSIRPRKPSSVPQDVACPQNRQSASVCAARSKTIAPLDSSTSNARVERQTQTADVWSTRHALVCLYASVDYRAPHESW